MVDSIYTIATSVDHWKSPFVYQDSKVESVKMNYQLTTREKTIAIGLAILTIPTVMGAVVTFYLVTAYFKNRALKQISYEMSKGMSIRQICPTTKKEIITHYGFGEFRPIEIHLLFRCACCQKQPVDKPTVI